MSQLLEVKELTKIFQHHIGLFRTEELIAVNSVSFTLQEGKTLAIIGENSSGKSTLAKMLTGILAPTKGKIMIHDHPLHFGDYHYRSQCIRTIFQDPSTSLNPQYQVGKLLESVLKMNTQLSAIQKEQRINQVLKQVGLAANYAFYYPSMLTSGQKQRVSLARALVLQPKIIIADDAMAYLDLSIRSQIINLMLELQEQYKISYIYVTQQLETIKHISDDLLVMQHGEIVERGKVKDVFSNPQHELTKRFIYSTFEEI